MIAPHVPQIFCRGFTTWFQSFFLSAATNHLLCAPSLSALRRHSFVTPWRLHLVRLVLTVHGARLYLTSAAFPTGPILTSLETLWPLIAHVDQEVAAAISAAGASATVALAWVRPEMLWCPQHLFVSAGKHACPVLTGHHLVRPRHWVRTGS